MTVRHFASYRHFRSYHRQLSLEHLETRTVFSVESLHGDPPPVENPTIEFVETCQTVEPESIAQPQSMPAEIVAASEATVAPVSDDPTPVDLIVADLPNSAQSDFVGPESATAYATAVDMLVAEPLPSAELAAAVSDAQNNAAPASAAPARLTNLTTEEQKALDLCGDDTECRKQVENLIEILRDRDAPPWFSLETITYGGRGVWWSTHCHSDYLDAKRDGVPLDKLTMTEEMKYYIGPNPLWSEHHFIKITLPNGTSFYADVYWLGGSDHIFFELPWSLVDADEYCKHMERCTAAMDATMH